MELAKAYVKDSESCPSKACIIIIWWFTINKITKKKSQFSCFYRAINQLSIDGVNLQVFVTKKFLDFIKSVGIGNIIFRYTKLISSHFSKMIWC